MYYERTKREGKRVRECKGMEEEESDNIQRTEGIVCRSVSLCTMKGKVEKGR